MAMLGALVLLGGCAAPRGHEAAKQVNVVSIPLALKGMSAEECAACNKAPVRLGTILREHGIEYGNRLKSGHVLCVHQDQAYDARKLIADAIKKENLEAEVIWRDEANGEPEDVVGLNPNIPSADLKKRNVVRDGPDWKNPFLVVGSAGIKVISASRPQESEIIPLEQLAMTLKELPISDWPYGRIIAIQSQSIRGRDMGLIRQNETEVEKLLKALGLEIDQWPSS